jgi:hypothetical protein
LLPVDRGAAIDWLSQYAPCPSPRPPRTHPHICPPPPTTLTHCHGTTTPSAHRYPHEKEVLLPPLTGLQALGTRADGASLLVDARLSLNMQASGQP